MDKTVTSPRDSLSHFFTGSYAPQLAKFDEAGFNEQWRLPYFLVFSFARRFAWREFGTTGDPVLSMIAGEIWLYNMSRALAQGQNLNAQALNKEKGRRMLLPKCNAYSLSTALGVPPETVRRKVQNLIKRGWVSRNSKGELAVTTEWEQLFIPEFNVETMRDFISSARALFGVLDLPLTPDASGDNSKLSAGGTAPRAAVAA